MLSLAYTPTAYNHRNFQSDICKAKRTNKKRTLEKVPFFCWLSLAEADLRGRKSGAEVAERIYARSAGSRDEA